MFYKRWWTKCAPVFSPLNSAISDQLTFSFLVRLSRRCKWENIMIMLFDRRYFCSAMKCPTHRADKWCSSEVINKINKKIVELDRRLCVRVCLAARKCDEIEILKKMVSDAQCEKKTEISHGESINFILYTKLWIQNHHSPAILRCRFVSVCCRLRRFFFYSFILLHTRRHTRRSLSNHK